MAVLPIYLYGSDVLRKKAKSVAEIDNSVIKLVYDMMETMKKARGIGLAATQVGEMRRVIVVDLSGVEEAERGDDDTGGERSPSDERKGLVLINPEVISEEGSWSVEEGCLSIPEVRADVNRSEVVRVRYRDINFREVEVEARGILGRVMLHEIDHLNGVLFIDRLTAARRALLKGELRKIKRGEIDTTYPVVTAVEV